MISLYTPATAHAQILDPQLDPGRLEERLPEQDTIPAPFEEDRRLPLIDGLPEDIPGKKDEDAIAFEIRNIGIVGNSVFTDEDLEQEISVGKGDAVTLNDLGKAASNITKIYRKAGYPLAKAFVPPQTVRSQSIVVLVAEGFVHDIEIRGQAPANTSKIRDYTAVLTRQRPVRNEHIERTVLLVNDISGLTARAFLSPVEGRPGGVMLVLLVERHKYQINLGSNNRGSDSVGPLQINTIARLNNPFGYDGDTSLLHLRTPLDNELEYWSLSHNVLVSSSGLQLRGTLNRSVTHPGGQAAEVNFKGQSNSYKLELTYPWMRTRKENLYMSVAFDSLNSSSEILNTEVVDDHIRRLSAKLRYNKFHGLGTSSARFSILKGLDIMDATQEGDLSASRPEGRSDAAIFKFALKRNQILDDRHRLLIKGKGQITADEVLSSDLFGVGGGEYGRGYNFSTITGENGYALSAQISRKLQFSTSWLSGGTISAFADWGQAYDKLALPGKRWQTIASAGLASQIEILEEVGAQIELAKPIAQDINGEEDYTLQIFGKLNFGVKF